MKLPVVIKVYFNGQLQNVKQFAGGQIVLGSGEEAQVSLKGDNLSVLHAVIEERESGVYFLSDLGSESGTILNGTRTFESRIHSGDAIEIGQNRIRFYIGLPNQVSSSGESPEQKPGPEQKLKSEPKPSPEMKVNPPPAPPSPPAPPPPSPPAPQEKSERPPVAKSAIKIVTVEESSLPIPHTPTELPPAMRDSESKSTPLSYDTKNPCKSGNKKLRNTFAPPSQLRSPEDVIKPGKGTLVEVLLCWGDRILSTYQFQGGKQNPISVFIGTDPSCDIVTPSFGSGSQKYQILSIGMTATAFVLPEMTGEYIRENSAHLAFAELVHQNKMVRTQQGFAIPIAQGDMLRVDFMGGLMSVYIRYSSEMPKPLVAPLFNLSSPESTGVILAGVITGLLALYFMIYTPPLVTPEDQDSERLRKAVVTFRPPRTPVKEIKIEPVPEKIPVKIEEKKTIKVADKKQMPAPRAETAKKPGETGAAAAVKANEKPEKKSFGDARPRGGAVNTGQTGANAQSPKPDPSRMGLLSAFGSKGSTKSLDKAFSGAGELQGIADKKTGKSGQDFSGDSGVQGSMLKQAAGGGKGTATVGVSGITTKGRGGGASGYGTGGLGSKGAVNINFEGQEAEFVGSLDKEAIRRVIREHRNEIKACYDRELNRNEDLVGKIVIEWTIVEKGRVGRAIIKNNEMTTDAVAKCVLARLKTWIFPEPPPNTEGLVSYPFVFASK